MRPTPPRRLACPAVCLLLYTRNGVGAVASWILSLAIFFAAPVRVAGTGPDSLPQILEAHSSLCAQAERVSLDMENYSVHPLLPAVILVCDRRDSTARCGSDGFVSLREVARTKTVLVVLTGENRSSTDIHISLDPLEPFALPIDRDDAAGLDVLRVPLDIAVRFVIELEARVDERKEPSSANLDKSLCLHQTPVGYSSDIRVLPQCMGEDNAGRGVEDWV